MIMNSNGPMKNAVCHAINGTRQAIANAFPPKDLCRSGVFDILSSKKNLRPNQLSIQPGVGHFHTLDFNSMRSCIRTKNRSNLPSLVGPGYYDNECALP